MGANQPAPPIRPRVLASTTSHKREPLLLTLEVFARLGLSDLDLNLHHLLEGGVPVGSVAEAVSRHDLRIWVLSGGWCDFFETGPAIDRTFDSVARQLDIGRTLRVSQLRLFFGRLDYARYSPAALKTICDHLRRLSDRHPDARLVFENHDGASLHPDVCGEIFGAVGRPNIRMNFDPINFAKAGADPLAALETLRPFVEHVHLKGLVQGEYCEYGEGDVNLGPFLTSLASHGYQGGFTVEYEGHSDGTLRLYRSVERARNDISARFP